MENVLSEVNKEIKGQAVEIAIGISLGGFILPQIAKKYSKAKLIFVVTGPYLKTKSKLFRLVLRFSKNKFTIVVMSLVLLLPDRVLGFFYKIVNPFKGSRKKDREYEESVFNDIKFARKITAEKELEIIEFMRKVDNSQLLKEIDNPALIICGKKDMLMPVKRGEELHRLLRNSQLILSEGGHFDAFTEINLKDLDTFVSR
jgi:pimeloyl-ACP methyl ester carboxylesterase